MLYLKEQCQGIFDPFLFGLKTLLGPAYEQAKRFGYLRNICVNIVNKYSYTVLGWLLTMRSR